MKITDPGIIQTEEKKLITAVQKHLDLEAVKKILMDRMAETSFASKGGQIVVHDNQIAFQLDFDLKLSGRLLFDRQGNFIPAASTSDNTMPASAASEPKTTDDLNDDEDDLDLLPDDDDLEEPTLSGEPEAALDDLDEDDMDEDDILDDDIDDILKESREFWDQKKGS
ncbi:MAG: hypothetical protein K9K63_04690 [Desulfotignum sp.]|nr:hypothetical protein [Desulfotignum sp.]MCF8088091.1 hypothetical protein [Desulfotignum sp.]MCF8136588.1 hypothetical protein [Desulfotignum sp.]